MGATYEAVALAELLEYTTGVYVALATGLVAVLPGQLVTSGPQEVIVSMTVVL